MAVGDITAAGTISVNSTSSSAPAAGSVVSIVTEAIGTVSIQLTGTWVGTIVLEGTITGLAADWITVGAMTLAGAPITNLVANGIYNINAAPFLMVRARSTAWTSGVANVALHGAVGTVGSGGGGGGGAATIADGSDTAEGATTDAAVQGDNPGTISAKLRGLNKSVAAGLPVTQQGTWTVQQGATPTAVGNAWPTKVTDGTNTAAVKAASTAALATDPSVVVAFSPNSPLPTGSATIGAVTGPGAAVLATDRTTAAAPFSHQLSDGAAFYVGAKTGQLPTALVGGRLDVNIGASGITQAVSGTVTANAGTGTFAIQATAAAPGSVELSDGAAFYVGAKTGQLPSALVGGRLDVNVGAALPTGANTVGAVTQASGPWTVNGPGANQAAVSGNPNWIAGSTTAVGGNLQGLVVESAAQPNLRTGVFQGANQALVSATGSLQVSSSLSTAMGDAASNNASQQFNQGGGSLNTGVYPSLFNGTNWDRARNNVDVTLLASAARTTTQTSADIVTYNCQALFVTLDMTTVGTASVTVTINYKDPASGKYVLLLSGAAITTNSTNMYKVDPRIPGVANVAAQVSTGRTLQIVVTANNANSGTYSVGYTLIPG